MSSGERATIRRLLGLDRSAEPSGQIAAGRPWRPWTIPNAITFARLALVPVFLAFGLTSEHRDATASALLFALIAGGDYADGAVARLTGQYSRLGALLDPATDRLLAMSGAVVCWRRGLLSRRALAVLLVREAAMLVLGRYGLSRGLNLRINRLGRIAIVPVMGSLFLAMLGRRALATGLLYFGLALALLATARYLQTGVEQLQRLGQAEGSGDSHA